MSPKDVPELLEDIGFKNNSIVETILVTRNVDGTPNPAPMGVARIGDKILEIKPFKSSRTFQNLTRNNEACINITQDPTLFLTTAFKKEVQEFHFGEIDNELRMLRAGVHIFIKILDVGEVSEYRSRCSSSVSSIELINRVPKVFSRGRAFAIEAIIHATRLKAFCDKKGLTTRKILNKFNICKESVIRVSPKNSDDRKVLKILEKLIKNWGY